MLAERNRWLRPWRNHALTGAAAVAKIPGCARLSHRIHGIAIPRGDELIRGIHGRFSYRIADATLG
jgi:hypothetical protein